MNISNFILTRYIWIFIGAGGIVYFFTFLKKIPAYQLFMGKMVVSAPMVAKYIRMIYTARFSTTLSNLYVGGVPLADALEISVKTIGNTFVEQEYIKSREDIARGKPLSSAIRHMTSLSPRMYQVVAVGEETGKLGEVLENMGTTFDAEVDTAISKMIAVLSPILLIFLTIAVGSIMVGILLPLMQSYTERM
jgi:type II secretory pathway component PulF